jgi:hypothetical protein
MTEGKLTAQGTGREVGYIALFLISNESSYISARMLAGES